MKYLFLFACVLSAFNGFTQNSATITYDVKYHGKEVPEGRIKLFIDGKYAHLQKVADPNAKEQFYLDYAMNRNCCHYFVFLFQLQVVHKFATVGGLFGWGTPN